MALQPRPPIITIMGHVDHGKTTLLDYIRKTNVQEGEAGGITQHIGAYQIDFIEPKGKKSRKLTFIDTPGHAAFNKMRERGAQVTDIVILVVAANDGVKPQTIESIRFIKQSNVPFVVAINKIDIKDVKINDVKAQLAEHEVLVHDFGGEVEAVEISAKTGKGVDKLLEHISVMADLLELEADPDAPLEAVVIESAKDKHKGSIARVIVQNGTLVQRQDIFVDEIQGKVRALFNEKSEQLKEITPGSPAEIIGLKKAPEVGQIVKDSSRDYSQAEEKTKGKDSITDQTTNSDPLTTGSTDFDWNDVDFDALSGEKPKLKLIVKADVKGTLEAILQTIDDESVELISSGVGMVTESDLELAHASKALVVAFHVKVNRRTKDMALKMGVKLKEYEIIYHLIEDLQKQMLKILEPTIDEVVVGEAEILQIFEMRGERIAGVRVKTGEINKNDLFHLKRGDENIADPVVKSMKHGKEEILTIKKKNEGGVVFKNKRIDFQVGDVLVGYRREEE